MVLLSKLSGSSPFDIIFIIILETGMLFNVGSLLTETAGIFFFEMTVVLLSERTEEREKGNKNCERILKRIVWIMPSSISCLTEHLFFHSIIMFLYDLLGSYHEE